MEALLSAGEVARLLNLSSRKIVYAKAAKGEIPSVKLGRLVRFQPNALRDLIESGRRPFAPSPPTQLSANPLCVSFPIRK